MVVPVGSILIVPSVAVLIDLAFVPSEPAIRTGFPATAAPEAAPPITINLPELSTNKDLRFDPSDPAVNDAMLGIDVPVVDSDAVCVLKFDAVD